jgi:hypothetical protein
MSIVIQQVNKLVEELKSNGNLDPRLELTIESLIADLRRTRQDAAAARSAARFWQEQLEIRIGK